MSVYDIEIDLADRIDGLAEFAECLGRAGVSLEGGGMMSLNSRGVAHFLVADGSKASGALAAAGIAHTMDEAVLLRLEQETPGQLGALARRLADAGVRLRAQYSDHGGALVLIPTAEHRGECARIAARWMAERHTAVGG